MCPSDWTDDIRDEAPHSDSTTDTDTTNHTSTSPVTIDDDAEPTVAIIKYECENCGNETAASFHGGSCNSPIIYTGEDWRCSGCETQTSPEQACAECGHQFEYAALEVPVDIGHPANPTELEAAIHAETNRRRAQHGLDSLAYSAHLSAIALQHSRDMAHRDFFDHISPDGASPNDRYSTFGHATQSSGENIARTYPLPGTSIATVAEAVVDDWMDSPGHRENILRDRFQKEGIGVYISSNGAMHSTQNFY